MLCKNLKGSSKKTCIDFFHRHIERQTDPLIQRAEQVAGEKKTHKNDSERMTQNKSQFYKWSTTTKTPKLSIVLLLNLKSSVFVLFFDEGTCQFTAFK